MPHYVYIIECINGALYTGYTTDVERRYQEHLGGSPKCKYTRAFPPKRLAVQWEFSNKQLAMSAEAKIKQLSRPQKLALIQNPSMMTRVEGVEGTT